MSNDLSKVEEIYNFILSEIAQQHYKEGDRIVISQVAKICHTSDIPVREALRRVESDGYVEISPNKGATVRGITTDVLTDLAEVNGILEGYTTRYAVDYLSPAMIRELRRINEEMNDAFIKDNIELQTQLNRKFHQVIFSAVPNSYLKMLNEQLWQRWLFMNSAFSVGSATTRATSYNEHLTLLEKIEAKDYDAVETFAREHKINALSVRIEQIQNH